VPFFQPLLHRHFNFKMAAHFEFQNGGQF